jgi:hypothetical protein
VEPTRVLLVANRTAADAPLLDAVRRRTERGAATFHLVVPASPSGLHRVVDPEDTGRDVAREQLVRALALLTEAAGQAVTGHVGDANPLCAVQDALNLRRFDEIIISTLPWRVSQWLRVDLPRKVAALGLPVLHVQRTPAVLRGRELGPVARAEVGQVASRPPSTARLVPVMYADASLARNTTAAASSSASPARPARTRGIWDSM